MSLGWLNIIEKKIIENYNSIGAEAHKVGKVVRFWPNFDSNFPDIWKVCEIGKLHIFKKFGFSSFNEIL